MVGGSGGGGWNCMPDVYSRVIWLSECMYEEGILDLTPRFEEITIFEWMKGVLWGGSGVRVRDFGNGASRPRAGNNFFLD